MTAYSHLFVHVADLERTRAFYVGTLGLEVLLEREGYVRVGGGGGFHIGFEEGTSGQIGSTGIEIVIRVDDVDEAYERFRAAGVVFDTAPEDQPWGARHAWLHDPDGYPLSICSQRVTA